MTKGLCWSSVTRWKSVYAHFPINVVIQNRSLVEIQNVLGEKNIHRGCQAQKDELIIEGSITLVSNSASLIQQATTIKNKNIKKFFWIVSMSEQIVSLTYLFHKYYKLSSKKMLDDSKDLFGIF